MSSIRSFVKDRRILVFAMVAAAVIACLVWSVGRTHAVLSPDNFLTDNANAGFLSGNTFTIDNADKFNAMCSYFNQNDSPEGTFYVNFENNIDMSGVAFSGPIYNELVQLIVDGNNHSIKNLTSSGNSCFISAVNIGSSVANLGLIDCSIVYPANAQGEFGLLWAALDGGGSISSCFVKGSMTVYGGSGYSTVTVGGLVGAMSGVNSSNTPLNNNTRIENSFALVDIDTDAIKVGGLVGSYNDKCVADAIKKSYSTGYIYSNNIYFDNNNGFNYVGGLIGYGEGSNQVADTGSCYTTAIISNPSAGTVKSVGYNASGKLDNIKYDSRVCVQRQKESVVQGSIATTVGQFSMTTGYETESEYAYPVLTAFAGSSSNWDDAKSISYLSSACAYVDSVGSGNVYDYYPKLGSTAQLYVGNSITNKIDNWTVIGGTDEYYSNFAFDDDQMLSASGFTYYSGNITLKDTGANTYFYSSEGDVVFIAHSGKYSRKFYASVTENNPYFAGGTGASSGTAFEISNEKQFNNVRVFTLLGNYHYKIQLPNGVTELSLSAHRWRPIVDFQGEFDGNYAILSGLSINDGVCVGIANDGGTGLFASTYSADVTKTVKSVNLYNFEISTNDRSNIGGIIGKDNGNSTASNCVRAEVSDSIVVGKIVNSKSQSNQSAAAGSNIGLIAGYNVYVHKCETTGYIDASTSNCVGGIIGKYDIDHTSITTSECVSTAVLSGNNKVGGIIGEGLSGQQATFLIFAGMIKAVGSDKNPVCCASGSSAATVATNCYYDNQTYPVLKYLMTLK